jgi:hypothetical protein
MSGNTAKNKAYYRCSATRPDYATPSVPGHPPSYMVREERILAAVHAWLDTLTHSDHSTPPSPPFSRQTGLRRLNRPK